MAAMVAAAEVPVPTVKSISPDEFEPYTAKLGLVPTTIAAPTAEVGAPLPAKFAAETVPVEVTGTANVASVGIYPLRVTFNQFDAFVFASLTNLKSTPLPLL